jgi:hypothetical protein
LKDGTASFVCKYNNFFTCDRANKNIYHSNKNCSRCLAFLMGNVTTRWQHLL